MVLFGKVAEIAAEYLKKGSLVYLQGRLQTRKWQGDDGQDRYTTEIVAEHMKMLGGKGERDGQPGGTAAASARTHPGATLRRRHPLLGKPARRRPGRQSSTPRGHLVPAGVMVPSLFRRTP